MRLLGPSLLLTFFRTSHQLQLRWSTTSWCLSVPEEPRNRRPLRLEPCDATNSNQTFAWNSQTRHLTWWPHPTFCVDVLAGCATNGNQVQIWECTAAPDDNHAFTPTFTQIKWTGAPQGMSKCLEVTDPSEPWLSYVQIWDCDSSRVGQELQLQ
jgi:hypothetical protein